MGGHNKNNLNSPSLAKAISTVNIFALPDFLRGQNIYFVKLSQSLVYKWCFIFLIG